MGARKIPFGFRPDVEDQPEPEEDERKQEISCTSLHEQKTWTPYAHVPADAGDFATRRQR